jgi:hypothetical protein
LLEGLSASLDGFAHSAFANFIAQAGRFKIVDDRLLSGFLFQLVDGEVHFLCFVIIDSVARFLAKLSIGGNDKRRGERRRKSDLGAHAVSWPVPSSA